ncbi:MAG: fibronectin type III domain-containing protein [Oscillospiraceae bacterium]|nr:fibronectin type III domain-containing protein [Oscillospiraceae bacterium]
MNFPHLQAPFSELYTIKALLSRNHGTETYTVTELESGKIFAMKHISIPASQAQIEALIYSGAVSDEESAKQYYHHIADSYLDELEASKALDASPFVLTYRHCQLDEKTDEIGFDLYLISDYLETLDTHIVQNAMTQIQAVQLGIDLCAALEALRTNALIQRDVKPSNIYLSPEGHYLLGDLGYTKIADLDYCAMPDGQFSPFTAPEFSDILHHLNQTADIYGVGMILYRIFNGNHGPFIDEQTSEKAAETHRLNGEPLPVPLYADYELSEILLKACAFAPEDRYQTPSDLKKALLDYRNRNKIGEILIVPPIITSEDCRLTEEAMDEVIEPIRFADVSQLQEDFVAHLSPAAPSQQPAAEVLPESVATEPVIPDEQPADEQPPRMTQAEAIAALKAASQPAANDVRKKRMKDILIIVAAAFAFAAFWYMLHQPVEIYDLSAAARDSSSITLAVSSSCAPDDLLLTCTDAYGNQFQGVLNEAKTAFEVTGLASGTQYTVHVDSGKQRKVNGESEITVSTLGVTDILSLTATEIYETGVALQLTVSGPEPVNWSLEITGADAATQHVNFSGHSARITGLSPATAYTFKLLDLPDYTLSGTREFSCTTLENIADLVVTQTLVTTTSTELHWTYTGSKPESWLVTYQADGVPAQSKPVTTDSITLTDLVPGSVYTVSVSCAGMLPESVVPMTAVIPSAAIETIEATAPSEDSIELTWTLDSGSTPMDMQLGIAEQDTPEQITYRPIAAGDAPEFVFTDLDPEKTYIMTLYTVQGLQMPGAAAVTANIKALLK